MFRYNIDTNPSNGLISFDVTCDVRQDGGGGTGVGGYQTQKMRVNMRKSYDDGNLTAGSIGIIVGVILAVILLIVAIGVLVFAKSTSRWCFADDEYGYNDPANPKSHPARAGQMRGPANQQAQVYRFIHYISLHYFCVTFLSNQTLMLMSCANQNFQLSKYLIFVAP